MSTDPRREDVLRALRTVQDPDLHRDLVSLGMIQDLKIEQVVILGGTNAVSAQVETDVKTIPGVTTGRLQGAAVALTGFDKEYFRGLPIPSQAITICSFILTSTNHSPGLTGWRADILAPMVIVLALAWVYAAYGSLPQAQSLLYGIKPVIIAIVVQALWGLARTALKGPVPIGWLLSRCGSPAVNNCSAYSAE